MEIDGEWGALSSSDFAIPYGVAWNLSLSHNPHFENHWLIQYQPVKSKDRFTCLDSASNFSSSPSSTNTMLDLPPLWSFNSRQWDNDWSDRTFHMMNMLLNEQNSDLFTIFNCITLSKTNFSKTISNFI